MPVGPIRYLTTSDLLRASHEREQHPLIRLLLSHLLATMLESPSEDTAHTLVNALVGQVIDTCSTLTEELRHCHPCLPSNPEEQAQMWQEATTELLSVWGYRDITAQVRDWYDTYAYQRNEPSRFDAQLVLKSARSVHYVRTLADVLITLDEARQAQDNHQQQAETDTTPQEEDDDAPRL
jgi:hypothetical protein